MADSGTEGDHDEGVVVESVAEEHPARDIERWAAGMAPLRRPSRAAAGFRSLPKPKTGTAEPEARSPRESVVTLMWATGGTRLPVVSFPTHRWAQGGALPRLGAPFPSTFRRPVVRDRGAP